MKRHLLSIAAAALCAASPTARAQCGLIISEYIEGSSNNKAIELYNGTGASIGLGSGNYVLLRYDNGSGTPGATISLTGTVAAGGTYVIAHSSASAAVATNAQQLSGSMTFNGDDALVLRSGGAAGTIIDSVGQVGFDPGTEWGTGLTSTLDNTIRRKAAITTGDTNTGDAFDPATEWDGYAVDTFSGLGAHTMNCNATNTPPALSTIGNKITTNGAVLTFSVSASDTTDNDQITLYAAGVPSGAVFDPVTNFTGVTNSFVWNPVGAVGVYTTSFFAADNDGETTQTITITVNVAPVGNTPPVMAAISPKDVLLGGNLSFTVSASDLVDGDAITLSASNLPGTATFATVTNTFGVTNTFVWLAATPVGVYTTQFYAVDNDGSTSQAAVITVRDAAVLAGASNLWINELNYDISGTDTGEFIEVAGVAGLDLSTHAVVLYDGETGSPYYTTNLTGFTLVDEGCGYGAAAVPVPGIQNGIGGPDGVALLQGTNVLQFLGYEGNLTASNGPAAGLTTTQSIGTQNGVTPTLQLAGTGTNYSEYSWVTNTPSPGLLNNAQYITGCSAPPITLAFSPAAATNAEVAGTVDVLIYKSTAVSNITAELVLGGTATQGVDYTISTTNISLLGATTGQTVTITLLDDGVPESNETVVLSFTNLAGAIVGAPAGYTLTITDDDVLVLVITTANQVVQSAVTTFDVGGSASTNIIGELSWTNAANAAAGTAPAGTSWLISAVPLEVGANAISVSGTNNSGNATQASVTLTRLALPRAGPDAILVQDFEGTDTWAIVTGAAQVSTNTGAADVPDLQRIYNGTQSWQVSSANVTLELASAAIGGYTGRQVSVRVASAGNSGSSGADSGDRVRLFVALDGAAFAATPEFELRGNSNARWGYWATNLLALPAASAATVSAPQGGQSTNNYSQLFVLIPDGATSVAVRVAVVNDAATEIWSLDELRVTGYAPAGGAPTNVHFFASGAVVGEDAGVVNVTVYKTVAEGNVTAEIQLSGTAALGADYTVDTTNIVLNGATTAQVVQVTVTDDGDIEGTETVVMSLVNVVGGGTVPPDVFTLSITNNDVADADGDGLPDAWEQDNFGGSTTNEAAGDVDADGFSNLDEYIAGTHPTNGQSYLRMAGVTNVGSSLVSFFGVTGRLYRLEYNEGVVVPGNWLEFTNGIAGTNGLMWVPQAPGTNRGLRVRAQLP